MTAVRVEDTRVGWSFWLAWVLASAIGFGVGMLLAFVSYAIFPISLLFLGVGGLAQWLVLRTQIPEVGFWAPASGLGFVIAGLIAASMVPQMDFSVRAAFLFAAVFGVAGGLMQWLILRKQAVNVGWWLAANLLGSLLGIALGIPAMNALQPSNHLPAALFLMIGFGFGAALGVGLGVTTGGTLVWLLRHPKSGPMAEAARQGAP